MFLGDYSKRYYCDRIHCAFVWLMVCIDLLDRAVYLNLLYYFGDVCEHIEGKLCRGVYMRTRRAVSNVFFMKIRRTVFLQLLIEWMRWLCECLENEEVCCIQKLSIEKI